MVRKIALCFYLVLVGMTYVSAQDSTVVKQPEKINVEQQPEFPGGELALRKHLINNLTYPKSCMDNGASGRIIVRFVIDSLGQVDSIAVAEINCFRMDKGKKTGLEEKECKALAEEAKRVVAIMPRWKPGSLNGRPVRMQYIMPVNFTLE